MEVLLNKFQKQTIVVLVQNLEEFWYSNNNVSSFYELIRFCNSITREQRNSGHNKSSWDPHALRNNFSASLRNIGPNKASLPSNFFTACVCYQILHYLISNVFFVPCGTPFWINNSGPILDLPSHFALKTVHFLHYHVLSKKFHK